MRSGTPGHIFVELEQRAGGDAGLHSTPLQTFNGFDQANSTVQAHYDERSPTKTPVGGLHKDDVQQLDVDLMQHVANLLAPTVISHITEKHNPSIFRDSSAAMIHITNQRPQPNQMHRMVRAGWNRAGADLHLGAADCSTTRMLLFLLSPSEN
jgi:hypothetical protein